VDGQLALDLLGHAWGDAYDTGRDVQTWRYRRKDGAGRTHMDSSSTERHKMLADDHAFFPVRRAS
jgi:hypothetical protein